MKQQLLLLFTLVFTSIAYTQNVGIGTTTPAEKLEIAGNVRLSAGAARSISVGNAPALGQPGNNLRIAAGSTPSSQIGSSGGNLELEAGLTNSAAGQAGGNIILTTGRNFWANVLNPSARHGDIIFRGGLNPGSYDIVEHARMDGTTGNWGFGTATPTARLDVVGTVKATGLQLTTGATAGFVLTSNASGVASWANAASLAISETDPKVGTNTSNYLSKWNGTALVSSAVFENGGNVGMGTASPSNKLSVNGNMNVTGNMGVATATPAANLDVSGSFKFGPSGTVLSNVIKFNVNLPNPQDMMIGPNSTWSVTYSPVAGAVIGSTVFASPSIKLPPGYSISFCRVSANNVVEIAFSNGTNAGGFLPAMTLYVTVIN